MNAIYILGEPGAGKSTLVEYLTRGLPYEDGTSPFAFRRYDCGVYELGKRREDFSGTDALAMDVQPKAVQFIADLQPKFLLAEGDRLANDKFFRSLDDMGYALRIYALVGPEAAARQRRERGSNQNETWLRGRATKAAGLTVRWGADILPAGQPLDYLERLLLEDGEGDPVVSRLAATRELLTPA